MKQLSKLSALRLSKRSQESETDWIRTGSVALGPWFSIYLERYNCRPGRGFVCVR